MKLLIIIFLLLSAVGGWFFSSQVLADKAADQLAIMKVSQSPVVVELYTSQGCSSCPPADRVIAELATQYGDRVLPLSFHVDYWDYIGWKDPFSSGANTERQRRYSHTFKRRNVYTPQAVIQGAEEMVGSSRGKLLQSIIRQAEHLRTAPSIELALKNNQIQIVVGQGSGSAEVMAVEYKPQHTTKILRGENRGETLTNYNIVTNFGSIGQWKGDVQTFTLPKPVDGRGIAILLQTPSHGRILAAAKL